jgi:oxygen-independent coproporphyrinogen-3 oxidase
MAQIVRYSTVTVSTGPTCMLRNPPLALYIHIPWCVRKCPYCDFNSHAGDGALPEEAYVAALLADLEQDLPLAAGRSLSTLFIGGGTPSLFSAEAIARLLEGVAERTDIAEDVEITLEANPGTVDEGRFAGFRRAGVNRLSIGIQSFNDVHLARLGRIHDAAAAARAARAARSAGFDNFNLDLMFGLPGQGVAEALADVQTAIDLGPSHISFYQLTLEPNTWFHRHPPPLPEDEVIWEAQRACQAMLAGHGYAQYEVSAYALEGRRCRHNLNYWRFGDYLGIGAGAHGKITDAKRGTIARRWKQRHPKRYLETAGTPECIGEHTVIAPGELPLEFLMNHLRLREGFLLADFSRSTGLAADVLDPGIQACGESGLLLVEDGRIRCTDKGWNFLDNVLEHFMSEHS